MGIALNPGCCCGNMAAWTVHHANVSPKYHTYFITLAHNYTSLGTTFRATPGTFELIYQSESGGLIKYAWCNAMNDAPRDYSNNFSGIFEIELRQFGTPLVGTYPDNTWLQMARIEKMTISGVVSGIGNRYEYNNSVSTYNANGSGIAYTSHYCGAAFSGNLSPIVLSSSDWNPFFNIQSRGYTFCAPVISFMSQHSVTGSFGQYISCESTTGYIGNGVFPDATCIRAAAGSGATTITTSGIATTVNCGDGASIGLNYYNYETTYHPIISFLSLNYNLHAIERYFCSGCQGTYYYGSTYISDCNFGNPIAFTGSGSGDYKLACGCTPVDASLTGNILKDCIQSSIELEGYIIPNVYDDLEVISTDCGYAGLGLIFPEPSGKHYRVWLDGEQLNKVYVDNNLSRCGIVGASSTPTGCLGIIPENPVLAFVYIQKANISAYYETTYAINNPSPPPYPTGYFDACNRSSPPICSFPYPSGVTSYSYYNRQGTYNAQYSFYIAKNIPDSDRHLLEDFSQDDFTRLSLGDREYNYVVDDGTAEVCGDCIPVCCQATPIIPPSAFNFYTYSISDIISPSKSMTINKNREEVDFDFNFVKLVASPIDVCIP